MKQIATLMVVLLLLTFSSAMAPQIESDYDKTYRRAEATGKKVMVIFSTDR